MNLLPLLIVFVAVKGIDHREAVRQCFVKNEVTEEQFSHFLDTDEASHNLWCTFRCVAEDAYDVIDASGRYMPEESAAVVPPNMVEATKECARITDPSSDKCEVGYRFHKCLYSKGRTEYVDFAKSFDIELP